MKYATYGICLIALAISAIAYNTRAQTTTCKPIYYGQPAQGVKCETQQTSSGFNQPNYADMAHRAYESGRETSATESATNTPAIDWGRAITEGSDKQTNSQQQASVLIGQGRCREAILVSLNASDMETAKATLALCKFLYPNQEEKIQ